MYSRVGPALHPFLRPEVGPGPPPPCSRPPPPSSGGAKKTMHPTLVSRKKTSTASVALAIEQLPDRGGTWVSPSTHPPHLLPHFHIFLACGAQALRPELGRNLDWRSPLLHHQHSLLSVVWTLSHRYDLVCRVSGEKPLVAASHSLSLSP